MPVMKPDTLAGRVRQAGGLQDLRDAVEQRRARPRARGDVGREPGERARGDGTSRRRWRSRTGSPGSPAVGTRSSRSLIRKNVDPQHGGDRRAGRGWPAGSYGGSGAVTGRTSAGCAAQLAAAAGMSTLSASREPGRLEDERHTGGRRVGEQLRERADADVALADPLVPVLEGAAHVHRVVGVHQPQPPGARRSRRSGPRSAVAPPGSSSGAPAAKTWQVSRQIPAFGWWSSAAR